MFCQELFSFFKISKKKIVNGGLMNIYSLKRSRKNKIYYVFNCHGSPLFVGYWSTTGFIKHTMVMDKNKAINDLYAQVML